MFMKCNEIQVSKTGNGYLIPTYYDGEAEQNLKEYVQQMEQGEEVDLALMEVFTEQYETDSECEFNRVIRLYEAATEGEKAIIDDVFVALCGWSLPTLLKMCLGKKDE